MTQPTRPYDALYDATFTVAGPRDHYRQQTLGGGFNIERAPVYNNFFSELPHYPPSTLRLKNADRVPGFVDRNYHPPHRNPGDLEQRSDALAVSGPHRPKYFRRPLLAAAEIHVKQSPLPPLPQRQDLNATAPAVLAEPRSKTIGTQSDYRENEAQTAPWEPGYVLPAHPSAKQQALSKRYHCDGPEVLHLRDMAFADGLPAGLQEVTRIDKMRAKRAFEATLPPIDDAARLPLRQKMIEEWENKEWEEREQEILSIQEQRLALLENALQVREEEIDEEHQSRVEDRKKATLAARAGKFADVQATRIKTMRQLIENRKYVEKHRKLHKPTIVERYANFGSGTYAPLQREGRFPESKPLGQEIETEGYEPVTLKGVLDLEAFLPRSQLNPKVSAPKRPNRLDFAGRKEAAVQRDLKTINDLLDDSKATAGRGHGDCWPAPLSDEASAPGGGGAAAAGGTATGVGSMSLKRASSSLGNRPGLGSSSGAAAAALLQPAAPSGVLGPVMSAGGSPQRRATRAVERPPTPELPQPPALMQPQHAALVLLQRLLRGRAAQNIMYEGRMRRQELIDELRMGERISPDGSRLDGAPIRRPDDRDAATLRVDALLGSVVSEVCAVLSETDPDKRNMLLAALGSSSAHTAAAAVAAAAADIAEAASAAAAANAAAAALLASQAQLAPPAAEPMPRYDADADANAAAEQRQQQLQAAARPPSATRTAATPPIAAGDSGSGAAINLEALGITREQAEEAALRIQAAFKGHHARKEVAAMRARGEVLRRVMEDGNEHKVVVCQAAIRGYLGRKRVREMREAKAAEEAAAAAAAAAAAGAEGGYDEGDGGAAAEASGGDAAAAAAAEAFDLTDYTDEQVEALTRIQAAGRGYLARKRVKALRQQQDEPQQEQQPQPLEDEEAAAGAEDAAGESPAEPEQEASQPAGQAAGEAEEPPAVQSDYTVEQEVAVIRIQAAGRGFLARKRVAAMRTETQSQQPSRPSVIGRQEAPEGAYGADAAEALGAAEGGEAEEEGEALWPKMGMMSGFTRGAAAKASEPTEEAPEPEAEASGAAAGAAEEAEAEASAAAEPEASLADGAAADGEAEAEAEAQQEPEQEAEEQAEADPEAQPEVSLADGTAAEAEAESSFVQEAKAEAETEAEAEASLAGPGGESSMPAEAEVEASLAGGAYGSEDAAPAGDEAAAEEGGEAGAGEAREGEGEQAEGEPSLAVGESGGEAEGEGYAGEASAAAEEAEPQAEGEEGEANGVAGEAEGEDPAGQGEEAFGEEDGGQAGQSEAQEEGQEGAQDEGQGEGEGAAQGDGDEAAGGEEGFGEESAPAEQNAVGEESQGWAAAEGQEGGDGEGQEGDYAGEGGEEGGEGEENAGWEEGGEEEGQE